MSIKNYPHPVFVHHHTNPPCDYYHFGFFFKYFLSHEANFDLHNSFCSMKSYGESIFSQFIVCKTHIPDAIQRFHLFAYHHLWEYLNRHGMTVRGVACIAKNIQSDSTHLVRGRKLLVAFARWYRPLWSSKFLHRCTILFKILCALRQNSNSQKWHNKREKYIQLDIKITSIICLSCRHTRIVWK